MLVDFWTYTCINCMRTLPYLEAWDDRYRADGLTIVGVHTPEFAFEHDAGNVARRDQRSSASRYPVVQDNEMGTWNAYGNQYWPADYLIDARGQVRYAGVRRGRLRQDRGGDPRRCSPRRGARPLGADARPQRRRGAVATRPRPRRTSAPRARTAGCRAAEAAAATTIPARRGRLPLNDFAYGGKWDIGAQPATARRRRDDRRAGPGASTSTSC